MNSDLLSKSVHQPGDQLTCEDTSSNNTNLDSCQSETAEEAEQQYLVFRIAGERFALEITAIREIARIPPIIELPRAPANIVGAVSFRGEIVGIFDLHQRLGLDAQPEFSRTARLIVAHTAKGQVGILVDSVNKVAKLEFFGKEHLERTEANVSARFFSGTVLYGDENIPVINLCEILAHEHERGEQAL